MNIKLGDSAVSEIISAILFLAIAISIFSIIYINVLADDGPNPNSFLTIIGKIDDNGDIIFDHTLGKEIPIESPIILTIAGQKPEDMGCVPCETVSDLLSYNPEYIKDGNWNIGEKLIYHPCIPLNDDESDEPYDIKAYIFDKESNSMVFWGTLQEGKIFKYLGGIWHFNESWWNSTTGEVIDSSGNGNHGTAYNGANTTDDVVNPLANRSGIFNIEDDDDYVEVPDDICLRLSNSISIEAWIKPFLDSFGTIPLLDQFGYTPYIVNLSGSNILYAVVSEDSQHMGNLQTINITPHKQLSEDNLVDIYRDFTEGIKPTNQLMIRPIITHVYGNLYIIGYNNLTLSGVLNVNLKTINISSDGYIEYTGNKIFDDNESDIVEPNRLSIVTVRDFESYSIIAIAYGIKVNVTHPCVGIIRTLNISHDGKIKFTGETAYFDEVEGYRPNLVHVSDNIFAIVYRNASSLGVVKTFNISSNGLINFTGKDFIFDDKTYIDTANPLNPPCIVKVSDSPSYTVFAISYGAHIDNNYAAGIIKTIKIYPNGTIIDTGFNKTFETSSCFNPFIIHHSENYYVVVYDTLPKGNSQGIYTTIQILDDGNITNIGSNIIFEQARSHNPIAIKFSERAFGILYESIASGKGHPGYLKPIQIEYPTDLYSKGIYKLGSYALYANPNKIFGSINNKTINSSVIANSWNYVVLTYDRNQMKLYVNGVLETTKPLSEPINITNSPLIFGELFYGLIDEVAIYDEVLSDQDVQNHFEKFAEIIISNVNSLNVTYSSANIVWDTDKLSNSLVRYGTDIPPINTISDNLMVTSHLINLVNLQSKTTYYYEVQSTSELGYTAIDNNGGRYYTFTSQNTPPNVPKFPYPTPNIGKKFNIDVNLTWVGGDEDGDEVTYDVYLGNTTNPMVKVSSNQSMVSYDPIPELQYATTYYWQIIAWDSYGDSTAGEIWDFTTINAP